MKVMVVGERSRCELAEANTLQFPMIPVPCVTEPVLVIVTLETRSRRVDVPVSSSGRANTRLSVNPTVPRPPVAVRACEMASRACVFAVRACVTGRRAASIACIQQATPTRKVKVVRNLRITEG